MVMLIDDMVTLLRFPTGPSGGCTAESPQSQRAESFVGPRAIPVRRYNPTTASKVTTVKRVLLIIGGCPMHRARLASTL